VPIRKPIFDWAINNNLELIKFYEIYAFFACIPLLRNIVCGKTLVSQSKFGFFLCVSEYGYPTLALVKLAPFFLF
jgi:hypothetical protein